MAQTITAESGVDIPVEPPYIIRSLEEPTETTKPKKKAKKAEASKSQTPETLEVSTYKIPNMGPYPQDIPKKNSVRFTPVQGETIQTIAIAIY